MQPISSKMVDIPQTRLKQDHDIGQENLAFDSPVVSRSEHNSDAPERNSSVFQIRSKSFENGKTVTDNGKVASSDQKGVHVNGTQLSRKISEAVFLNVHPEDHGKDCWYTFCFKCRKKEPHPSWQPNLWPVFCPYPFCPTYRQFARLVSLGIVGILIWCILYAIAGDTMAPPHGKIFRLIVLCLFSYVGGWLMVLINMPGLIGMLFMGILVQNVGIVNIDDSFSHITKELRSMALVIILIRAGLDMDPIAFRKIKWTILKIGLVPWVVEVVVDAITCHYFLGLPWDYAFLLTTIVAAVSPAVVVPSMFRLRTRGYGVAKGIPTLIIAIAGIDDAASVAFFGITKSIMFPSSNSTSASDLSISPLQIILQGPIAIIGGLAFGLLWGVICHYAPEKHDPFLVPMRILMLLTGGTVSIFGTELLGYAGAGPLACVGAAFACLVCWSRQGWNVEYNPANTAFEIIWMIFEPILFGITGAQIRFSEMDRNVLATSIGILVFGFIIRILATVIVGIKSRLNMKEKIFVAVAVMSKASVQAALGPVALSMILDKTSPEYEYGKKILLICILSIILTAPTGALFIIFVGPKLLTKTRLAEINEEWSLTHRPSIRDLTINEERNEASNEDDKKEDKDKSDTPIITSVHI